MEEDTILEVERDREGRIVVTLSEAADPPVFPDACATCLAEPATTATLVSDFEFPCCDACKPPASPREQAFLMGLFVLGVVLFFARKRVGVLREYVPWLPTAILIGGGVALVASLVHTRYRRGRERPATELLLGEGGTIRFAFLNEEYARRFLAANGAGEREVVEPHRPADPRDEEFPTHP